MRGSRRAIAAAFVVALALAAVIGIAASFTEVEAKGPCRCPQIYAPVECDKGKIFPNQCVADCRGGKNCVPIGPGPVPVPL